MPHGLFNHGDEPTIADLLRGAQRRRGRARAQGEEVGDFASLVAENQMRRTGSVSIPQALAYAEEVGPEAQEHEANLQAIDLGNRADISTFQNLIRAFGGGIGDLFTALADDATQRRGQVDSSGARQRLQQSLGGFFR